MKTEIMGVCFDNFSVEESVEKAMSALKAGKKFFIVTPNPEIVNVAIKDEKYKKVLNSADVVTPDGIGIVYASKMLGGNVKTRAPGFDIVKGILKELSATYGSVYLFGGKPGVADMAAEKIKVDYPGIKIAGTDNGYFDDDTKII